MDPEARADHLSVAPGRRLAVHLLLLAGVLVVASLVVGTHGRYSADEGAVVVTARSLARGDGWLTPAPVPAADPSGRLYPLVSSAWGRDGVSAYAKHPTYAAILGAAERTWSGGGVVSVSVVGTIAAAGLSALLARRLFPGTELVALWMVGVGGPLFVDAQLLMAHTLAAATATGAVLAADGARRRSGWRVGACLLLVATAVGATALLRTEGVLFGLALGGACGLAAIWPTRSGPTGSAPAAGRVVAGRRLSERLTDLATAAAAVAGAVAAVVVDRAWLESIVGPAVGDPSHGVPLGSGGFVGQRIHGFVLTMFRPAYGTGTGSILLVVALGLLVLALVTGLRAEPDLRAAAAFTLGAAVVVLVRAVALVPDGVPGLLVAFPVGWVGLVVAGRATVADDRRRMVAVTAGLFVAAVAATQYAVGGGVEWGGRYFALAIPLVAPAAASGVAAAGARLDGLGRRLGGAGLVGLAVGLAILGVRELNCTGTAADTFYRDLPAATAGLGRRPVVVTTDVLLPRLAGPTFDADRWLLADREHPDRRLVARLRAAGVERFALVTDDPDADAPLVADAHAVRSTVVSGRRVTIYATRASGASE